MQPLRHRAKGLIKMKRNTTILFAQQFCKNVFQQKAFYVLWLLFAVLLTYAAITGTQHMAKQNELQQQYQQVIRKSWEDNPDKHPHRMAHFGSFALRIKHPLSLFDFGMENYAGNAVFLEAHKQNTVNYSEASFSTGLLRMGELSMAMLLQIILPLIVFFLGFGCIAADRENGTLKMISSQGAGIFSLLMGRTLGLWLISALFFIPAFILTAVLLNQQPDTEEMGNRLMFICLGYALFFWVMAAISIAVSATSHTAKAALIKLLGIWLLLAVLLPKMVQVVANVCYPSPSKLQFETAIEKDIVKQGDSHNPDDPYFKKIKDSVFKRYGVTKADSLPINLGGVIGKAGEALSAVTYIRHQNNLTQLYRRQNGIAKAFAWVNPFVMIKSNSMALAGTDFEAYTTFQQQAETYRYALAQRMNDLQIQHISNVKPKAGNHLLLIDKKHWEEFEDFEYQFLSLGEVIHNEAASMAALFFWLVVSLLGLGMIAKRFKMIV
jgi:ABC-2 type transport system permease protein